MALTLLTDAAAARLSAVGLTYSEVGLTAGVLPPGYHHQRRTAAIGSGPDAFAGAASALLSWQVHLRAGLRVCPSSARAEPGAVLILGLGAGPLRVTAPCRVVYAVDEPGRRGFGYGTLPGHPECGEEAFIIERHADDTVSFTITAFSRPARRLAKAAGPVGRAVQRRTTTRYLRALGHDYGRSAPKRAANPP
ncbi:MAG: hypothetical protein QOJ73_6874 [Streptosporangiaceae bacterium]|nr:hypothetical protein [Streptosporangiaceae bacterium]